MHACLPSYATHGSWLADARVGSSSTRALLGLRIRGSRSGEAQPTPSRCRLQAATEVQARPSSWRPCPRVEGHARAPGRVVEFQGERQQMRALSEFIARSRTVPCVCIAGIVCPCSRNPGSVAAPTAVRHEGRRAAQRGWRRGRQRCGTAVLL